MDVVESIGNFVLALLMLAGLFLPSFLLGLGFGFYGFSWELLAGGMLGSIAYYGIGFWLLLRWTNTPEANADIARLFAPF